MKLVRKSHFVMFVVYLIIETLSIIGFEQSVLVVFVQGNESNEVFGMVLK